MMKKSFIMIRPDGGQILDGIDGIIKQSGFDITDIYNLSEWDKIYLALHEKELKDIKNSITDNIKLNVWMSKQIYGNSGLILLLTHNFYSNYEDLIAQTYDLKFKIRDKFQSTRDGKFVIAINASLIDVELLHINRYGNLVVNNGIENLNFSIKMQEKGNYVPAYFNYIHCPDNSIEEVSKEYEIMHKNKVLVKTNRMSNQEYEICKKMHSCYRV